MKELKRENGNSLVYILWLLSVCGVILLIVVNIARVYLVKQQAETATQLAALAGTSVLLKATDEVVLVFDADGVKSAQQFIDDTKSVTSLVNEKKKEYIQSGKNEQTARIKAYNDILPTRIKKYPELKDSFEQKFKSSALAVTLNSEIYAILIENGSSVDTSEIVLSNDKWRIEVKAEVEFSTLTDGKLVAVFTSPISQKGFGPQLSYLKNIY